MSTKIKVTLELFLFNNLTMQLCFKGSRKVFFSTQPVQSVTFGKFKHLGNMQDRLTQKSGKTLRQGKSERAWP